VAGGNWATLNTKSCGLGADPMPPTHTLHSIAAVGPLPAPSMHLGFTMPTTFSHPPHDTASTPPPAVLILSLSPLAVLQAVYQGLVTSQDTLLCAIAGYEGGPAVACPAHNCDVRLAMWVQLGLPCFLLWVSVTPTPHPHPHPHPP